MVDTGQGLIGTNMFAYCENNPVMFLDPAGTAMRPWSGDTVISYWSSKGFAYQYTNANGDYFKNKAGVTKFIPKPQAALPPKAPSGSKTTKPKENIYAPNGGTLKTNNNKTVKFIPPGDEAKKFLNEQRIITDNKNFLNNLYLAGASAVVGLVSSKFPIAIPYGIAAELAMVVLTQSVNHVNDNDISSLEIMVDNGHGVIRDEWGYHQWDTFDEGHGAYPHARDNNGGGMFTWNE